MIGLLQLQALALGGSDGGRKFTATSGTGGDGAVTGEEVHVLQIASGVTFSTLTGVNADGDDVDMLDVNGFGTDEVTGPLTVGCPDVMHGGYIKAWTITAGEMLAHKLPNSGNQ